MEDIEAWDMLHGHGCEKKSLSKVLTDMGFDRDSFLVVKRDGPRLDVGDRTGNDGKVIADPYLSFGVNHLHPSQKHLEKEGIHDDFGVIDKQMRDYNTHKGKQVNGMTGSNNGVYCAMANGGDEFIITKDPAIAKQLSQQLGFAEDQLGVPLSNGGKPVDFSQQKAWDRVDAASKNAQLGRLRGTEPKPKRLESPFRKGGERTPEYNKMLAARQQGGRT